jgi:hypothetical protein
VCALGLRSWVGPGFSPDIDGASPLAFRPLRYGFPLIFARVCREKRTPGPEGRWVLRMDVRAKQAAEKVCTGQENNTSGAKALMLWLFTARLKVVP